MRPRPLPISRRPSGGPGLSAGPRSIKMQSFPVRPDEGRGCRRSSFAEENAWPAAAEEKVVARWVARSAGCAAGSATARNNRRPPARPPRLGPAPRALLVTAPRPAEPALAGAFRRRRGPAGSPGHGRAYDWSGRSDADPLGTGRGTPMDHAPFDRTARIDPHVPRRLPDQGDRRERRRLRGPAARGRPGRARPAPSDLDHSVRSTPGGRHVAVTLDLTVQTAEQVRADLRQDPRAGGAALLALRRASDGAVTPLLTARHRWSRTRRARSSRRLDGRGDPDPR